MENKKLIDKTLRYMVQNFEDKISLDEVASHSGVSKFHLCRIFKDHLKVSPICWLWRFRVFVSAEIICQRPVYPIHIISEQCGFKSPGHFAKYFKNHLNMRPSNLKKSMMKHKLTVGSKLLYKSLYDVDLIRRAFEKAMLSTNKRVDIPLIDVKYSYVSKSSQATNSYPVRL